ncbi:hypothetical protein MMC11_008372 [Xylographa trunciseda]|nr:hypothetical protein [Xylographa trunciseda]
MNSKSMDDKMRLGRAPANGENPAQLHDTIGRQIEYEVAQKAAARFVPTMMAMEHVTYYRLFGEAKKAKSFFITMEEALQYSEVFRLPPEIIRALFANTDTNSDEQWNIDEFTSTLRAMEFELQKKFANGELAPRTSDERQKYCNLFEVHNHPGQPVGRSREIAAASKEYPVPEGQLKRIWKHAEVNNDRS